MEIWGFGGLENLERCSDVEAGVLEAHCGCNDVEVWRPVGSIKV